MSQIENGEKPKETNAISSTIVETNMFVSMVTHFCPNVSSFLLYILLLILLASKRPLIPLGVILVMGEDDTLTTQSLTSAIAQMRHSGKRQEETPYGSAVRGQEKTGLRKWHD